MEAQASRRFACSNWTYLSKCCCIDALKTQDREAKRARQDDFFLRHTRALKSKCLTIQTRAGPKDLQNSRVHHKQHKLLQKQCLKQLFHCLHCLHCFHGLHRCILVSLLHRFHRFHCFHCSFHGLHRLHGLSTQVFWGATGCNIFKKNEQPTNPNAD